MSSKLIGSGEALIASWMIASVGFLASMSADMSGLQSSVTPRLRYDVYHSPDARDGRKRDRIKDTCKASESCSYPYSAPPPSKLAQSGHLGRAVL